jgi:hypothetical protein
MTWKWRILQVVKFLVLVIAFYVFKVQDLPWWRALVGSLFISTWATNSLWED